MFGQTCTASGDSMRQYAIAKNAHPKKSVVMDIECDAGCGVVPMRYRDKSFVNAMQWVIGLETFLLFDDPWRIFLTTDHPNGAPFLLLSASHQAAHGQELPRRDAGEDQPRRAGASGLVEVAHARIHARRDRHSHARRAGQELGP